MCAAGGVDSRHAFLDMRDLEVAASAYTRAGRTCPPAMGFSFAAGTTDGAPAADAISVPDAVTDDSQGLSPQSTHVCTHTDSN